MKVYEIMNRKVVRCHMDDTLQIAAGRMWAMDVGALPVVDDHDRVVGMITDRDITMASYLNDCAPSARRVRDTVSGRVYTVGPEDEVSHAEEVMSKWQVRRLPIVDAEGRLSGVITVNDIARTACVETNGRRTPASEVAQTLRAIAERRTSLEVVA